MLNRHHQCVRQSERAKEFGRFDHFAKKKKPNNKDRFELNIRAFAASLLLLFEVFVYKCTNDDRRILLARVCIEVHVCEQKKKTTPFTFLWLVLCLLLRYSFVHLNFQMSSPSIAFECVCSNSGLARITPNQITRNRNAQANGIFFFYFFILFCNDHHEVLHYQTRSVHL